MKKQNIPYQNNTKQFDTNFPHYYNKEKKKAVKRYSIPKSMSVNVPATAATAAAAAAAAAAAPGSIAVDGGPMSKPLILLLQL